MNTAHQVPSTDSFYNEFSRYFHTSVLQQVSTPIMFLDAYSRIIWANSAMADIFGLQNNDMMVGRHCREMWESMGGTCSQCPLIKALETGQRVDYSIDLSEKGTWDVSFFPMYDSSGIFIGAVEMAIETTPRILFERSQRHTLRALRCLSASVHDIVTLETEQDIMRAVCAGLTEVGGYCGAVITRPNPNPKAGIQVLASSGLKVANERSVANLVSVEGGPNGRSVTPSALRTGQTQVSHVFMDDERNTPWLSTAVDECINAAASIPIVSQNGQVKGALTIYASQKESFKAQELDLLEQLTGNLSHGLDTVRDRREKAMLFSALGQISDGLVVIDNNGFIRYANESAAKIVALTKSDLIGCHFSIISRFSMVSSNGETQLFPDDILESLDATRPWADRISLCTPGEQPVILDATLSPILYPPDNTEYFLLLMRDATQQVALEAKLRQKHKLEALGTLARGLAHDFNNILSIVMGYTEASITRLQDKDALSKNLLEIMSACERADKLVKKIVGFNNPNHGKRAPTFVGPILREVLGLLRSAFPSGVRIFNSIESDAVVYANSTELFRLFMNLGTNACQAMPEGGSLTLSMEMERLDSERLEQSNLFTNLRPGDFIKISFIDTGVGLNPEHAETIFDPFFTTRKNQGGSGLGLSVSRGVVNDLGGMICVANNDGPGARFDLYLPLCDEKPDQKKPEPNYSLPGGSETILVVDDEPSLVDSLCCLLQDLGYQVVGKTDSNTAMRDFASSPSIFDLVITDLSMPGMPGDELAERIHGIRPEIPVIINSGLHNTYADPEVDHTYHVNKPIRRYELAQAIRRALAKSSGQDQSNKPFDQNSDPCQYDPQT